LFRGIEGIPARQHLLSVGDGTDGHYGSWNVEGQSEDSCGEACSVEFLSATVCLRKTVQFVDMPGKFWSVETTFTLALIVFQSYSRFRVEKYWTHFYQAFWTTMNASTFEVRRSKFKLTLGSNVLENAFFGLSALLKITKLTFTKLSAVMHFWDTDEPINFWDQRSSSQHGQG